MKITQVSKHIWSLNIWLAVPIRVWVVVEAGGVTLVDAGISPMAKGILKFIDRLQAGPLRRIVLTHGHPDHTGALKRILKSNPAPVYAHAIEIPYLEGAYPYPRRKKAAPSVQKGTVQALQHDKSGQLQPVGGLAPHHTPGHSPGHVVYYHDEDQVLLAGDLFTSKNGRLRRPMRMFTADMREAVQSSSVVRRLQPDRLEVSHGGPVFQAADQLDAYVAQNSEAALLNSNM